MLTQDPALEVRAEEPAADPIGAKLARLEAKPSLRLDDVDYDLRDPDAVRARLAEAGSWPPAST